MISFTRPAFLGESVPGGPTRNGCGVMTSDSCNLHATLDWAGSKFIMMNLRLIKADFK